jgi:hypothetical protein
MSMKRLIEKKPGVQLQAAAISRDGECIYLGGSAVIVFLDNRLKASRALLYIERKVK